MKKKYTKYIFGSAKVFMLTHIILSSQFVKCCVAGGNNTSLTAVHFFGMKYLKQFREAKHGLAYGVYWKFPK